MIRNKYSKYNWHSILLYCPKLNIFVSAFRNTTCIRTQIEYTTIKTPTMLKKMFFILLLIAGNNTFAQQTDCKVLKPEISGTYSGDCKKGLAHGKGIAQGTDRYEGQFSKGLPDGTGTYKWANGVYYEGEWNNGLMEGNGKMVYPDSIVTGMWKQDQYIGKKAVSPYKIIRSMSVTRYTITKAPEKADRVKIRITQAGRDNSSGIVDFSLAYDSGSEYRNGSYYGIDNIIFPVTVKVKYRTWNLLRTTQYDVQFEFLINERGSWDVVISN